MPTAFDSLMASTGRPLLRQNFGASVVYKAPGLADVTCTAQLSPTEEREIDNHLGRVKVQERKITLSIGADLLHGVIAKASESHRVAIDGEDWPVNRVEQLTGSQAVLVLRRSPQAERSRPNLTGRP